MKHYYQKLFAVFFLSAFLLQLNAANDTLTIGKAFDWQGGDSLRYQQYRIDYPLTGGAPNTYYVGYFDFTVLQRVNYTDSIAYQIKYSSPDTPMVITALNISKLDSPVINFHPDSFFFHGFQVYLGGFVSCDSPASTCKEHAYIDTSFDHRIFLDYSVDYQPFDRTFASITYGEKTGIIRRDYSDFPNPNGIPHLPHEAGFYLVYYHSNSFSWLGITEENNGEQFLTVYPNPTNGKILIEKQEPASNQTEEIKIYDLQSRVVYSKKIPASQRKEEIDISSAENGIYIIAITDEKSNILYRNKIIKQ